METKFRARKLDFNKPLPVFRIQSSSKDKVGAEAEDESVTSSYITAEEATSLIGITEDDSLSSATNAAVRAMPNITTGVDKEEEDEVHLQTAITAASMGERAVIPTPSEMLPVNDFDKVYPTTAAFHFPFPQAGHAYVRLMAGPLEDRMRTIPQFNALPTACNGLSQDQFELIVDCWLEGNHDNMQECILDDADNVDRFLQAGLKLPTNDQIQSVESTVKRISNLGDLLRTEDNVGDKLGADPYVCFRRRALKTQQRKTRRADAAMTERIQALYSDLDIGSRLARAVNIRDRLVAESARVTRRIFETYRQWQLADPNGYEQNALNPRADLVPRYVQQKIKKRTHPKTTAAAPLKISIPVAKAQSESVKVAVEEPLPRFFRPHYTPETLKAVTRDIEALMAADAGLNLPGLPSSLSELARESSISSTENDNFDANISGVLSMFGLYSKALHLTPSYKPFVGRHRRRLLFFRDRLAEEGGLQGRILKNPEQHRAKDPIELLSRNLPYTQSTWTNLTDDSAYVQANARNILQAQYFSPEYSLPSLRILPARDCAQLNNARVGNLNQYYLQQTVGLPLKYPQTLVEWIAATKGVLASATASSRKFASSPKKRALLNTTGTAGAEDKPPPHKRTPSNASSVSPAPIALSVTSPEQ